MPPQQQPSPIENVEVPAPEIHETPALEPAEPATAHSYKRPLIGLAFLTVSAIGGLGVLVALMPSVAYEEPQTQLAAAAAKRTEPFNSLDIAAQAAFVYDIRRDSELFAKNPSAQLPLASLTKVMLVLAVAEVLPLDGMVTISRAAVEKGGGGLTWGEEWNVRDLIDFTLITSSNTGAEALAEAASPLLAQKYPGNSDANATVWRMNALAEQLGMRETYFVNVTGLDESPTQAGAQGSARDIATLFAYALRTNPGLFDGTTQTDIPIGPANFPEREAHNTNNALADITDLLMGKTGTTDLAGGNLAIAFLAAPERPIVVVVLSSSALERFEDVKKLVEAARTAVSIE